jgi:hypothetical protein
MVLTESASEPGDGDRIMVLLGTPAPIRRLDLLLPQGRGAGVLAALDAAARDLAQTGGSSGWQIGARAISPRLGTLTVLAPVPVPVGATLPADRLILDTAAGPGRLRLLLGGLLVERPASLQMLFDAGTPAPALFLDGARHPAQAAIDAAGRTLLEATLPRGGVTTPTVLGLAGPGDLRPLAVEIGA